MVNFRQLEVFRAVVDTGTTSDAAVLLNISQPAISNMIKHAESQLGFKLFKRAHGRLWQTQEAEHLYAETEPLFTMFRSVQQTAQDLRDAKIGSLGIVATPSIGASLIPTALTPFLEARPEVRVSVEIRGTEHLVQFIDGRLAEVGVSMEPLDHPTVVARPIHRGTMACVMPSSHPLAKLKSVQPRDLSSHQFVALGRTTPLGMLVERAFQAAKEPYRWQVETRYCNAACAIALENNGVTVVDPYTISQLPKDGLVVRPFKPKTEVNVFVVYSAFRPLSALATAFIADLEASLS